MTSALTHEMGTSPSNNGALDYPTVEDFVGNTPLVRLQRLKTNPSNVILAKLEGNNPAGSVKDRPAVSMIAEAEQKGLIKPGDTLIEATSGNTGIALAMAAAIRGYKLKLIMPANMSEERRAAMAAYGAELISVPAGKMELARDLAHELQARGVGVVLDQFGNPDNPLGHFKGTGPELWEQTSGRITHFVSSMGTTGTIMGVSRYLKEKNPDIQIVGLQPAEGASIAGIRRWPKEYLPKIFQEERVDRVMEIGQREAEETMRALAKVEGIFAGVSSGGAVSAALRLSAEVENATIVCIICDRGDRYLSTGVFSEEAAASDPQPCSVSEFPSAAARLIGLPEPHYILFTADPDPETGAPWCPDCARCLGAARSRVAAVGGTLLEVQVGQRPVWKDKGHPLRHHAALQLKGIPTLVRWQPDGTPGARLGAELEAASTPQEADQLIKDFVSSDLRSAAAAQDGSGVDVQALIQELDKASMADGAVAH
ncbi:Cysteine synthase B [Coccomyxa sp. Obi]|nr:Cysteine synthase B [Coccomyxa sp. Obi]